MGVLLVDDEEKTLKYFDKVYSKFFPVFCARNVEEAKQVLRDSSDKIGVLITDQRMPGEKGTDLLAYTKAAYPEIVRILTTAFSDINEAAKAVNQGEIYRYILKPWDLDEVKNQLLKSLEHFTYNRERDRLINEKLSVKEE